MMTLIFLYLATLFLNYETVESERIVAITYVDAHGRWVTERQARGVDRDYRRELIRHELSLNETTE